MSSFKQLFVAVFWWGGYLQSYIFRPGGLRIFQSIWPWELVIWIGLENLHGRRITKVFSNFNSKVNSHEVSWRPPSLQYPSKCKVSIGSGFSPLLGSGNGSGAKLRLLTWLEQHFQASDCKILQMNIQQYHFDHFCRIDSENGVGMLTFL